MNHDKTLLVYGLHAVHATLTRAATDVLELWIRHGADSRELEALAELAQRSGVNPQRVTADVLDRFTAGATHQGVVVRRRPPSQLNLEDYLGQLVSRTNPALLMVIDQVQDPHNLGACLRVADAAGADAIVVTKDRSASVTSAVAKVASGALDSVPLIGVTNLASALQDLKAAGIWLVGAVHGVPGTIYALDLKGPIAWVIGGEGRGLRRLTRDSCDFLASIPMRGQVASLNLATAAAVCLYETVRQRGSDTR